MESAATRGRLDAGGLAGVLSIAVAATGLAVLPIWDFPGTGATGPQLVAFVDRHSGALRATMACYTCGVTLWLLFGAALWSRLASVLGAWSVISAVFGVGVVGFVTMLLSGFTAMDVLIYRGGPASEARLLYDLAFGLLAMSGMPTALALTAYAAAVYRTRTLPRYTGHLAAVAAVAHALLLLSFIVGRGFFSLEGPVITVIPALLWAWILITGLAQLRTRTALPA